MHRDFYRLLDTFAMLKADADAGPLDDNTDPAKAKFHKTVFARTKYALMGRIQVARVKCVDGTNHAHHLPAHKAPHRGARPQSEHQPARQAPHRRGKLMPHGGGAEEDDGLMTV